MWLQHLISPFASIRSLRATGLSAILSAILSASGAPLLRSSSCRELHSDLSSLRLSRLPLPDSKLLWSIWAEASNRLLLWAAKMDGIGLRVPLPIAFRWIASTIRSDVDL